MACWRLELLITFQLVEGETNLGGSLWRGYNETEFLKKILPNLPTSRLKKKKTKKNKSRLLHVDRRKLSPNLCRMGNHAVLSLLLLLPVFTIYLYYLFVHFYLRNGQQCIGASDSKKTISWRKIIPFHSFNSLPTILFSVISPYVPTTVLTSKQIRKNLGFLLYTLTRAESSFLNKYWNFSL